MQAANGGVRESSHAIWLQLWPDASELLGSALTRSMTACVTVTMWLTHIVRAA
ncbi:MAG: hypothetical protein NTW52_00880 [Planctomycetota bacterium]|nr:hypothetical protein [Planctomycetota bacterium]